MRRWTSGFRVEYFFASWPDASTGAFAPNRSDAASFLAFDASLEFRASSEMDDQLGDELQPAI
jgi:hypothetical protein